MFNTQTDESAGFGGIMPPPLAGARIFEEGAWRQRPDALAGHACIARWSTPVFEGSHAVAAPGDPGCHTLTWTTRQTRAAFMVEGRTVHDGAVAAQTLMLVGAGRACEARFFEPATVLRMYLPQTLLDECLDAAPDGLPAMDAAVVDDAVLLRLVHAASAVGQASMPMSQLYVDGISLAVAARLAARRNPGHDAAPRPSRAALSIARVDRVKEYIHSRIGEPLRLADLASVAGLSRMRFAEQFRVATGLSPHRYVQRQRIARSQDLLLTQGASVADIALAVGFQTQAHFTVVFKHVTGETPDRWRREMTSFASVGAS